MKRFILGLGAFLFLTLLVVFPESCVQGAKAGLLLWFQTIIPNLLPFLIVSGLIIELDFIDMLCRFTYPVLGRILRISKNGCYPIVIGLLSGFPVGAKACGDLVGRGLLNKREGQFLLGFCNNASPMFIISFIATEKLLIKGWEKYLVWLLILLSGLFGSVLVRMLFPFKRTSNHPSTPEKRTPSDQEFDSPVMRVVDQSILGSFEILTKVGGYIILFSILAKIIQDASFLPVLPKLVVIGTLEITTGIHAITQASIPHSLKIILCCSITAFGGISALAQTKSVTDSTGLSLSRYFICKLLSGALTFLLLFYIL